MTLDLGNVVVTGGASGLGAAVCDAVYKNGGLPIALDLKKPDNEYPFVEVDLSDCRKAEQIVSTLVSDLVGINGVVTAAGIDACGKLDSIEGDAWDKVIRVNLMGTAAVVRAALPSLKRTNGKIVTVASTLGFRALPDASAYCASKFGIVGFTRSLSAELKGEVGVTLLVPGGMSTPFFDGRDEKYKPEDLDELNRPENVANAVIFALQQPANSEVKEIMVCPSSETSWP